jgi:hypothetical protein
MSLLNNSLHSDVALDERIKETMQQIDDSIDKTETSDDSAHDFGLSLPSSCRVPSRAPWPADFSLSLAAIPDIQTCP